MFARIKYLSYSIHWYAYRTYRVLKSIPVFMWEWLKEYWFQIKMINKGFHSFADVWTIVKLYIKGFFATAVMAYMAVKKEYAEYIHYMEYKIGRLNHALGWDALQWYEKALYCVLEHRYNIQMKNLKDLGLVLLSPPSGIVVDGEFKHVG